MKKLLNAIVIILLSSLFSNYSFADTGIITISPSKEIIEGNKGDTIHKTITIKNTTNYDNKVLIKAENFESSGSGGIPYIVEIDKLINPNAQLSKWITVKDTEFIVNANSEYKLDYTINIPLNGIGGGHYGSISFFYTINDEGPYSINIKYSQLILLNVKGGDIKKLALDDYDFNFYDNNNNLIIDFPLKNIGNTHILPNIKLYIYNKYGVSIEGLFLDYDKNNNYIELNKNKGYILPGTNRLFKNSLKLNEDINYDFNDISYIIEASYIDQYGNISYRAKASYGNILIKQIHLSKKELDKTSKGKKYISTIDLFVKKTSKEKLENLETKLSKFDTNLPKFKKYKDLVNYLEAKVGLELINREK